MKTAPGIRLGLVIAGHSLGDLAALDVTRQLPEKVMGILAIDELHDANAEVEEAELEQLFLSFEQDFVGTCNGFVRAMFVDGMASELPDRIAGDTCSGPAEIGAALFRAYAAFDLPAGFSDANVPIRAINADLWPTNPEGNRQLADFDVMLMEGRGHSLMHKVPEALAQEMIGATLTLAGGGNPSVTRSLATP